MDKNSLLASLTGDLPGADGAERSGSPDQDLFGNIGLDDDPPPLAANTTEAAVAPTQGTTVMPEHRQNGTAANGVGLVLDAPSKEIAAPSFPTAVSPVPVPVSEPAIAAPPAKPADSLLSKSGLLMGASDDGGGGGLFDQVDQEEREQQEREAEEKRRVEEEQRKREEEERRRKEEEEKRRQEALEAERKRREEEQLRLQQQQQQQLQQQQQQQMQYQQQYQQQQQQQMPSYQQQPATMQSQAAMMQQQQLDNQFQSISLNGPTQQYQQPPQQHPMAASQPDMGGFYRDHAPAGNPMMAASAALPGAGTPSTPSNTYGGGPGLTASNNGVPPVSGTYYYGTQQPMPQSQQPPMPLARSPARPVPPGPGSTTAGMHNATPNRLGVGSMGQVRKITLVKPQETPPMFTKIAVTDPMLIQNSGILLMASPPYWSYQVTSNLASGGGVWLVRRRFRHVVALEERMRHACPGCILPPRPDKHATRALEEASAQQSAEFAMHRAREMEAYLTALAQHPIAGHSHVLKLFLGLQDDIGTAWAEVSPNALTRLGAVGAGASMKVAEAMPSWAGGNSLASSPAQDLEDNAEIIALHSSEHLRMGAVSQAVPKLEGAVALWRESGDLAGATGMELSKLAKQPDQSDFGKPAELLSNGILRHGRRTKRLALELSAALEPFMMQYKLCKYEKLAFQDRREALLRRSKERGRADSRATMLVHQQRQLHASGQFGRLDQLERNATTSDEIALDAVHDADEVGATLRQEINRVAYKRRTEWHASMKVIASAFKEASSERLAIWESTREAFDAAFPEYSTSSNSSANGTH